MDFKRGAVVKTIVLGIDGGTLSLFETYAEKGYLPNVAHLLRHGTRGLLKSTYPAITAPAWVSFMTGLPPDKHGILDFLDHSQGTSIKRAVASSRIQSIPFWQLAGDRKRPVIVFNVPITYPPYPVNGVMLTGMLTPSLENVFTYPPELGSKLLESLGDYYINVPWRKYRLSQAPKFIDDVTECTRARTRYLCYLMKYYDWDLTVAVFTEVDSLQHALWCYIDDFDNREILKPLDGRNIQEKVICYYRHLDSCIGEILENIKDRYRLFIVSDHGFGPLKGRIHLNLWLNGKGLLFYRRGRLLFEKALSSTRKMAKSMDIWDWRTLFRKRKGRVQYRDNVRKTIDWARTKAFSAFRTEQGIYINLKGRQEHGIVEPSEFDSLREEIVAELRKLRNPVTDEEIRLEVFNREDIYQGPFSHYAPDILVNSLDDGYNLDDLHHEAVFDPASWDSGTGTHRTEGMFVAYGADIRENVCIEGTSIIDIAPSVMYAMGLPVPVHMEGKVLVEIFKKPNRETHPIRFAEYKSEITESRRDVYSQEEEAILRERLKDLGYLD